MKQFNPEQHRIETASALEVINDTGPGERYGAYVGLAALYALVYAAAMLCLRTVVFRQRDV